MPEVIVHTSHFDGRKHIEEGTTYDKPASQIDRNVERLVSDGNVDADLEAELGGYDASAGKVSDVETNHGGDNDDEATTQPPPAPQQETKAKSKKAKF